ncbi:MAG TPA: hypothetical protein VEG28_05755 [Dehalococcoidia bacterium]|nr:hypothetical protein [Dehalococcoidia bacterium]
MKPRLLLLFKILGYSFVLFLIGHKFFHWYAATLIDSLNVQDPRYHLPPNMQDFLYGPSMTIIAFIALMLSTPKMTASRKAGIISLGIVGFVLIDFFFLQYLKGTSHLTEDSLVFEMYLCVKWLLPFVLWIVPNYPHLRDFFGPSKEATI